MAMSGRERQRRYRATHPPITAPERYVVCRALAYAIVTIERLPKRQHKWSDKEAMMDLLDRFATPGLGSEYFLESAIKQIDGTELDA